MSIRHLFRAVAIITVFSVITRILGFGFRIFLSRQLGAELLGFYSIALAFFGVLNSFVSSGIPVCVSKKTSELAAKKADAKASGAVLTAAIVWGLVFAAIAAVFVFVFKWIIAGSGELVYSLVLVLVPAIFFSSIYSAVRGSLWGYKNFYGVCVTELIEQILRIVFCVVFFMALPQINKALSAAVSLSLSVIIAALVTFVYYIKSGRRFARGRGQYKKLIKSSMPITAVRFTGSFIQPAISIIIPIRLVASGFTKGQAVAALGVAMGMVFPILYLPGTIVGSLSMALVPDISGSLARSEAGGAEGRREAENLHKRIRSSLIFTLVVAFAFVPLFVSVGRQIGIVLFNNQESGILLARGAIIMVPISLSNISSAILNSLGLEVKSMRNYMMGSLFLFACIWFLPAHVGGGMALLIGMGICTGIAAFRNIRMIEKKLAQHMCCSGSADKLQYSLRYKRDALILLVFSLLCGFLGRSVYGLFAINVPMFAAAVFGGSVALACFYILLISFKFIYMPKLSIILKHKKIMNVKSLL